MSIYIERNEVVLMDKLLAYANFTITYTVMG